MSLTLPKSLFLGAATLISTTIIAQDNTGAAAEVSLSSETLQATNLTQGSIPAPTNASSPLAADIQNQLQSANLRIYGQKVGQLSSVKQLYQSRQYRPIWVTNEQPNALAKQLDQLLGNSINHGLSPLNYDYAEIAQAIRSMQMAFYSDTRQLSDFDIFLTSALVQFGKDLTTGKTNPRSQFSTWTLGGRSANTVNTLSTAIAAGNLNQAIQELVPPYYQYAGMVNAIDQLRRIAAQGGWPSVKNWGRIELGQSDGRIPVIREILYIMGDYQPASQASLGIAVYDMELEAAVKSFQARHGLTADGIIGSGTFTELNVPIESRISKLEVNMERWRWLPNSLGARYIMVNIPDFRVKVIEGQNEVLDSKIVVGRKDRPTEVFSDRMEYTVMNPYWHVPQTIAVEDKLPRLKRDPYAMAKSGIRIFRGGSEVDPGTVNWNALSKGNFPYQLRQDPGDGNALGNIKFIFPNRHAIYMHDTPSRGLFGKNIRAYSSGCIRVEKYLELAQYVLPDWSRDRIIQNTSGGSEKRVNLSSSLPVHILYFTAWVDQTGKPHFRPDIYNKDRSLANKLGL